MGSKGKDYLIEFNKLTMGLNHFEFNLNDAFFAQIEGSIISKAEARVTLELIKTETMYELQFTLTGTVSEKCDNCLSDIDLLLDNDFYLLMKISENEDYSDDEIIYVTKNILEYNLTQYLYESFILSIPPRKVCEMAGKKCDPELVRKINNFESDDKDGNQSNPMWDKLKGIF
jgi:uncharacterized metal-binding protein YceD (DUF177 family)